MQLRLGAGLFNQPVDVLVGQPGCNDARASRRTGIISPGSISDQATRIAFASGDWPTSDVAAGGKRRAIRPTIS
jgi:hypothetical protein